MALRANQIDYKNGFKKHFHPYKSMKSDVSDASKQLILVYCIECGLKYLFMKKKCIYDIRSANQPIQEILHSHDFQVLLKELNVTEYRFPVIHTVYNECITAKRYHEACRYVLLKNDEKLCTYNKELDKVAEWIDERI